MHTTRRPFILALCALALAGTVSWAHAQADALAAVRAAKKVRIGMDVAVAPYAFKDDRLQLTGSDAEVAKLLAYDLGVELEIVPLTSANRVPFLVTQKVDLVISTLAITPERQKVIDFTVPYSAGFNGIVGPKSVTLQSPADLAGKKVAVTRGTTYDTQVTTQAPKSTEIVRFDDEATTMTALVSGQVDIVAQSFALTPLLQKRAPSKDFETKFVLEEVLFGIGVRKGSEPLRDWADAWVKANLKNGKLNDAFRRFHGQGLPAKLIARGG